MVSPFRSLFPSHDRLQMNENLKEAVAQETLELLSIESVVTDTIIRFNPKYNEPERVRHFVGLIYQETRKANFGKAKP